MACWFESSHGYIKQIMKFFLNLSIISVIFLLISSSEMKSKEISSQTNKKISIGLRKFENRMQVVTTFDYSINRWLSLGAASDFALKGNRGMFLIGRVNFDIVSLLGCHSNINLYPGFDFYLRTDGLIFSPRFGFFYFFSKKLGGFVEIGNHGSLGILLKL